MSRGSVVGHPPGFIEWFPFWMRPKFFFVALDRPSLTPLVFLIETLLFFPMMEGEPGEPPNHAVFVCRTGYVRNQSIDTERNVKPMSCLSHYTTVFFRSITTVEVPKSD